MQRRTLLAATAAPLLLAACTRDDHTATPGSGSSAAHDASTSASGDGLAGLGLANASAVTIIETLDSLDQERPLPFKASITGTELVVTDKAGEHRLALPADRFYLSVAPYVSTTHECFNHSLSGCQGEQAGKAVHLKAVSTSGKTLVETDATTGRNGFVGIWLPRNQSGTLTATMDGRTGSTPFATAATDPTCLTTLQLV